MGKSYLYANGVVSALSTKLITKDCFNRMIEAKSNIEALNILQETAFGSGLTIDSPFEIEELTTFETKKLLNFIKEESPSEELTNLFLLPYDYSNIAGVCKAIVLNQDEIDFVEVEGLYEISKIKDLISSKRFEAFNNPFIENCLKDFQELSVKNLNMGYEIDLIFKTYLYKNLLDMSKKSKLINEIVNIYISIENISIAMRSNNVFIMQQQLLKGGFLTEDNLLKVFNKDNSVLSEIKNNVVKKFVEIALMDDNKEAFVRFEILKNNFVFSMLLPRKYDNDSLTPFALYCFEREAQIKNVRLIMSYQNNNLSKEIKKRFLEW